MLSELQLQDAFCANILAQIEKGNITKGQMYKVQNKLLRRYVIDGDKTYETIVLPELSSLRYLKWHMMTWDIMELTEHICC